MAQLGKRIPKVSEMIEKLPRVLPNLDTVALIAVMLSTPDRPHPRLLKLPNSLKLCLDILNSKVRGPFPNNIRLLILSPPLKCLTKVVLPFR